MSRRVIAAALLCGLLLLAGQAPGPVSIASTIQLTATPSTTPQPTRAAYLPVVRSEAGNGTPTTTPLPSQLHDVTGAVFVKPRWAKAPSNPTAYLVLLDTSGSMSYDFAGNGTLNGVNLRCEAFPPDALPSDPHCDGGVSSAWHNQAERRIYVVKQALLGFIDQFQPITTMRIIAFSSALGGHVQLSASWTTDKTQLKQSVLEIGAYNGDAYRSAGDAPAAASMRAARQILAAGPPTAPNGQPYRMQLIYIADSVPNVFLDGERNTALDICPQFATWPPPDNYPACQYGQASDGRLRPLSALIDQATQLRSAYANAQIAVVGLAGVPLAGLDEVASDPGRVFAATSPDLVTPILATLLPTGPSCIPVSGSWLDRVDAAHTPNFPPPNQLPAGVLGYAYVYDANFQPLASVPITHDAATGALGVSVPGLATGNYFLKAFVGYKGDDQVSRMYNQLRIGLTLPEYQPFTIPPNLPPNATVAIDPIQLELAPAVDVCG